MGVYHQIGKDLGAAKLAIAKALGLRARLTHRGDPDRYVFICISREGHSETDPATGIRRNEDVMVVDIPRQDGFGAQVDGNEKWLSPGDEVLIDGDDRLFIVEGPIESRANGYVHRCVIRHNSSATHGNSR